MGTTTTIYNTGQMYYTTSLPLANIQNCAGQAGKVERCFLGFDWKNGRVWPLLYGLPWSLHCWHHHSSNQGMSYQPDGLLSILLLVWLQLLTIVFDGVAKRGKWLSTKSICIEIGTLFRLTPCMAKGFSLQITWTMTYTDNPPPHLEDKLYDVCKISMHSTTTTKKDLQKFQAIVFLQSCKTLGW